MTVDRNQKRIAEIDEELKDFADNLAELESRRTKIIGDRASNDSIRIAQNFKDEKRDCEEKINAINQNVDIVRRSLSGYAENFERCAKALNSDLSSIDVLNDSADSQANLIPVRRRKKIPSLSKRKFCYCSIHY